MIEDGAEYVNLHFGLNMYMTNYRKEEYEGDRVWRNRWRNARRRSSMPVMHNSFKDLAVDDEVVVEQGNEAAEENVVDVV